MREEVVFDTPWFQLVAKVPPGWKSPHYSIRTEDYVCVVARCPREGLVLVRQYRPAVSAVCLELPSGHVERGEAPEDAARRELLEETGYRAGRLRLLGKLAPDVGRLGNSLWCYFAEEVSRVRPGGEEAGVEAAFHRRSVRRLLGEPQFNHALHFAALLLAVSEGCIPLTEDLVEGRAT
jgi:8-oxo-dGTP pyrophosphatase MutT (NUDIX family)